jgi:hypothetical protein
MMPENTDAILTYDDRWTWDFHSYMIDFTVEVHSVRGHKKLADGRDHQPSITPKAPSAVIHEVLSRIFE